MFRNKPPKPSSGLLQNLSKFDVNYLLAQPKFQNVATQIVVRALQERVNVDRGNSRRTLPVNIVYTPEIPNFLQSQTSSHLGANTRHYRLRNSPPDIYLQHNAILPADFTYIIFRDDHRPENNLERLTEIRSYIPNPQAFFLSRSFNAGLYQRYRPRYIAD